MLKSASLCKINQNNSESVKTDDFFIAFVCGISIQIHSRSRIPTQEL